MNGQPDETRSAPASSTSLSPSSASPVSVHARPAMEGTYTSQSSEERTDTSPRDKTPYAALFECGVKELHLIFLFQDPLTPSCPKKRPVKNKEHHNLWVDSFGPQQKVWDLAHSDLSSVYSLAELSEHKELSTDTQRKVSTRFARATSISRSSLD